MFRTLFSKILIWSAAAHMLFLGSLLALATFYVPESEDAVNNAWSLYAHDAVMLYEKMGPEALEEFLDRTGDDTLLQLQLALAKPGASCSPASVNDIVGESKSRANSEATTTIETQGSDGIYCLTVHAKPGGLPETAESRHSRMRFATLFELMSSVVLSYFIARYLSRPISELRRAAAQLAQGDLSARAGGKFTKRKDEAADLVREFDRMAERLSDLIEAKHRLIADISHEIKSPLARLSIALGLARISAEQYAAKQFDRMEREVEKISLLASELLSLERVGSTANIHMETIDLCALVEETIADAQYEFVEREADFVIKQPKSRVEIRGDENLLRRLIENLVRNSVFYTLPNTKIEITISTHETGRVLIEVRDYGSGVPSTSLPYLFEPFYRVDEARGRKTGGTGIGLAICQRITNLHQGTIRASNGYPKGLIINIDLPIGETLIKVPTLLDAAAA